jgi:hypothetical protein
LNDENLINDGLEGLPMLRQPMPILVRWNNRYYMVDNKANMRDGTAKPQYCFVVSNDGNGYSV